MRGIYSTPMSPEGDGGGGGGAPAITTAPTDSGSLLSQPSPTGIAPSTTPITPVTTAPINIPENWKEALPEEFRNDPSLKHINKFEDAIKSYIHAQKQIGGDKVLLPSKHATKEEIRAFQQKVLNIPSNLQDYKIDLPNDPGLNEQFITQLREQAFNIGIAPAQMSELLNWYSGANKSAVEQMNQEYKAKMMEGQANLQKEWGQTYGQNLELAKRAAKHVAEKVGVPNINTWLDGTGMGDDPVMIKMLAFLGGFLKEDGIHGSEHAPGAQTPNQIQDEIRSTLGDSKHPYFDKTHPNHKAAVDHMQKLYQALHPTPDQRLV